MPDLKVTRIFFTHCEAKYRIIKKNGPF